jgi:hypothetical protein
MKCKCRYTETITQLNSQMIRNNHRADVIQYFSHFIRGNECRNTYIINSTTKLEMVLEFLDHSYLGSGRNWIPMSFGSNCDILQRWNEMLGSYKSNFRFERQYDIFRYNRRPTSREKRRAWWVEMCCRSAEWTQIVPNQCCGVPMRSEEYPN